MIFDVFISHSKHDKTAADAACAALEAAGVRCWIAPRDVEPGAQWAASIMGAIKQCRVMVLIYSGNANGSNQVQREVQNAFDRNVPVIPLRLENVAPEGNLEFYMGSVHWLDALTPPLEQHLARLTQTVTGMLRSAPPRTDAQERTPERKAEQGAIPPQEAAADVQPARAEAADSSAEPDPQRSTRPVTPPPTAETPDISADRAVEAVRRSTDQTAAGDAPLLFISHAAEDAAAALEICAAIEKRGVRCWIAPRDIALDDSYQRAVVGAIDRCRALLLILSHGTPNAEHVFRELELAIQCNTPIFPLRIQNVAPAGGLRWLLANRQIVDGYTPLLLRASIGAVVTLLQPKASNHPIAAPGKERKWWPWRSGRKV